MRAQESEELAALREFEESLQELEELALKCWNDKNITDKDEARYDRLLRGSQTLYGRLKPLVGTPVYQVAGRSFDGFQHVLSIPSLSDLLDDQTFAWLWQRCMTGILSGVRQTTGAVEEKERRAKLTVSPSDAPSSARVTRPAYVPEADRTMEHNALTIHEQMLLRIDEAIRDRQSPHRDKVTGGVRADTLANSMEGVDDQPAAAYAYAIRDLKDTGDVADLNNLRLTEKGALRVRKLRSGSASTDSGEPVAFLIMPFDESFDDLKKSVIDAGESVGLRIKRADDIFSGGIVLDQIEEQIRTATVIIAVCTRQNANVFYELGIARQWHAKPILLAAKKEDLPFDIGHYRAILYDNRDLKEIAQQVAAAISETISPRSNG